MLITDHEGKAPGRGAEKGIKLVLVAESQGPPGDSTGVSFAGEYGVLLDQLVAKTAINPAAVRYEPLVRFHPTTPRGANRAPDRDEIATDLPYLYRVLQAIVAQGDTPVVVALGVTVMTALTGQDKMRPSRGRSFRMIVHPNLREEFASLDDKVFVVPTYSPSGVLRGNQNYVPYILQDLTKAWKTANNDSTTNIYWKDYRWVFDPDDFDAWAEDALAKFSRGDISMLSYDTETSSLDEKVYDPLQYVVCASLCIEPGKAIVVPLKHVTSNPQDNDHPTWVRLTDTLRKLLTTIPVCGWGLTFDIKWTQMKLGTKMTNFAIDGLLASKWLYGSTLDNHGLDHLASTQLGFEGHGEEVGKSDMFNCPQGMLLRYAGGDADASLQFCMNLLQKLAQYSALEPYKKLPLRALKVLPQMEMSGIAVSKPMHNYLMVDYVRTMAPLEEKIKTSEWGLRTAEVMKARLDPKTGKPKPLEFNVKSRICMLHLLYTEMKLPVDQKKMKKTGPSIEKEVITELRVYCADSNQPDKAEILDAILQWGALKHTLSTFIENIGVYSGYDGFFHTQYQIAGTETGRLSTRQPSLHGQPKGSKARWQFVSRWEGQGGLIVAGDGSQMEMRILAMLSGDKNLIETLQSGVDLHTANAEKMYKVKMDELDGPTRKKYRNNTKAGSFGCVPMDTLALTPTGWKAHADLSPGDTVLGYDQVLGKMKWTTVLGKVYHEKAPLIHMLNKDWKGAISTPDHRWFGDRREMRDKKRGYFGGKVFTTESFSKEDRLFLSAVADTCEKLPISLVEAELLGWIWGDGSIKQSPLSGITAQGRDGRRRGLQVLISQSKPKGVARLKELLTCIPHYENTKVLTPGLNFVPYTFTLHPTYARDLFLRGSLNTLTKSEFVLSLSTEQRKAFLDGIIGAEGTPAPGCATAVTITQNLGETFEAILLAAFLCGHAVSVSHNPGGGKGISKKIRLRKPLVGATRTQKESLGEAPVWCLVTELGSWVMRQGLDQITITGNSIFGIGPNKLAAQIKSTRREAEEVLNSWYATFPGTKEFQRCEWSLAKKNGYTFTHFGRIRHIEDIKKSQWGDSAWRKSINTAIQSTASDIILVALMELYDDFERRGMKSQLFGSIHDAIVVDTAPGELFEVLRLLKYWMQDWTNQQYDWRNGVDIIADFEVGAGWGFPLAVDSFDPDRGTLSVRGSAMNTTFFAKETPHLKLIEKSKVVDSVKQEVVVEYSL